jgi:hypothetical protein
MASNSSLVELKLQGIGLGIKGAVMSEKKF